MTSEVLTVTPATTLGEALRITRENNIRHLPVMDGDRLIGLVTDRDLRLAAPPVWATDTDYAALRATFENKKVADVMTASPIVSTTENTPIEEAAQLLYEHRIGCVPVMRDDKLVGILTETDVMHAFVELFGSGEGTSRIEVQLSNRPGEIARVVRAIGVDFKINITGLVLPPSGTDDEALLILRVQTTDPDPLVAHLRQIGYRVGSPALELEPASAHKRERLRIRHWAADGF